ncbi:MAG: ABC transporter substrate-binding protein [Thermodesulfobacteriota bacterium]
MTGKRFAGVFIACVLLICFGVPDHARGAREINYRLKWLFNVSTVGDLYADVHGLFEKNGLDVTIKPGGPERDAIRELELGYAQFGVASADQVIRALSKGASVVVLAQLFQVNPLQWVYRASRPPINELSDLTGRIIGITYGGNDETIMRALLAKGNVRVEDVDFFSVRYNYLPFYRNKVELWPCYRNAQGPILAEKLRENQEEVAYFDPAKFGIKFVANSVVTSAEMLKNEPETVEKFMTALLQGWRESLDPGYADRALETLAQFDEDTPPDILIRQLNITRAMIKPAPDILIGAIDVDAWKQTETIMLDQKLIPEPVNVERVLIDPLKPDSEKTDRKEKERS